MSKLEFKSWPKIPRANAKKKVIITEKMDGTNGCIIIKDDSIIGVQSRKKFIKPNSDGEKTDNFGFAQWVQDNEKELLKLGNGYHYGEWVGEGIQRNPHNLKGKHFYLFNSSRWNDLNPNRPSCCNAVPILYEGVMEEDTIDIMMNQLRAKSICEGYIAEGIIIYSTASKMMEKVTFEYSKGKWTGEK